MRPVQSQSMVIEGRGLELAARMLAGLARDRVGPPVSYRPMMT